MFMKSVFVIISLLVIKAALGQTTYKDSMEVFRQQYVQQHAVVAGENKQKMQFFPVDPSLRVVATFSPAGETNWISFKTSGSRNKLYRLFGTASFTINGQQQQLQLYQSQELLSHPQYANFLFLPFTDATSGSETYVSGRYVDLTTADIQSGQIVIDFNKAYNPYCAYVSGVYNCPIPPKENALAVAIRAGEKNYEGGK